MGVSAHDAGASALSLPFSGREVAGGPTTGEGRLPLPGRRAGVGARPVRAAASRPSFPAEKEGGGGGGGGMIMESLLAAGGDEAEAAEAQAYSRHVACARMGLPCPDLDGEPCWYCEDDCCSYEDWEGYGEEEEEEEEEEEQRPPRSGPGTFCGFKKSFLCKPPASEPGGREAQDPPLLGLALPQKQQLTAQEAEENAEELVAEEERLKKKAEKKRMKKKRQKDRKRQEKRDQELKSKHEAETSSVHSGELQDESSPASALRSGLPGSEENSSEGCPCESPSRRTEEEEVVEEELDLTSTFVSKARLKVVTKPLLPKKKTVQPGRKEVEEKVQPEHPRSGLQMTPVEQSMVLADRGNESAKQGHYQEAVLLFTEAVKLNPREYRFFGNRSFCYERLQCYAEALRDAQLALSLQPGWPKGLFRQGKALMGLKRYMEAARTFEELLSLGDFRSDAAIQLKRCQLQHLLENGFSGGHPDWSPWAREACLLLSGDQQGRRSLITTTGSISGSGGAQAGGHLASLTITTSGAKGMVPSAVQAPIREYFAVWVGNLTPKVTQEVLLRYFQPFGPIHSMRHLPRRFCAFINYTQKEAAEAAYTTLQGAEVEGSRLLLQLKHPVHATPAFTKAPSGSQQPLRERPGSPPASTACSWFHSLGHFP